jgi:hypothetical protein
VAGAARRCDIWTTRTSGNTDKVRRVKFARQVSV